MYTRSSATPSPLLLFNIDNDPGERTNLAETNPAKRDELLADLAEWEKELIPPKWVEGERWEKNQIMKHRMEVETREQERKWP